MTALILRPASFNELAQFSNMAAKSAMVPPSFRNKPEDIMLAVQMGSELGLAPMQALQNIAVINNRPSVWGDALIGLCRASANCEDIAEKLDGEGEAMVATCMAKRRNASPVVARFSVADAKKAGLWGKAGPWQQYPARMLQLRARGFALRDAFPDVLRGLISAEEARDMPNDAPTHPGPTIEAVAVPETPQPTTNGRTPRQIIEAFQAVKNAQDYYDIIDNDGERIAKLKELRPAAFEQVEDARKAAAARMEETPVTEAPAAAQDGEVPA